MLRDGCLLLVWCVCVLFFFYFIHSIIVDEFFHQHSLSISAYRRLYSNSTAPIKSENFNMKRPRLFVHLSGCNRDFLSNEDDNDAKDLLKRV